MRVFFIFYLKNLVFSSLLRTFDLRMKRLVILTFLLLHAAVMLAQQNLEELAKYEEWCVIGTVTVNGKEVRVPYYIWRKAPEYHLFLGQGSYGAPAVDTTTVGTVVVPRYVTDAHGQRYLVVGLARQAFAHCRHITEVILHDSITHIGDQAFLGCESLTRLSLPASIQVIWPSAFRDCPRLNVVRIGCTRLPKTYDDIFDRRLLEHGSLFIPHGTSRLYSNSLVWGIFRHRFELAE